MERKDCLGLVRHRDCLVLTLRGWLLLVLSVTVFSVVTIRELYPFLAVTEPVGSGLLVVEGWVTDITMNAAFTEFKQHNYKKICVTGGPIEHTAWANYYKTYAEEGKATLLRLGLHENEVQALPSPWVRKDRTYASAAALAKWIRYNGAAFSTIHLITEGAHARRSRLLFQKALGRGVKVGVTSVPDSEYDPEQWWRSSAGVRMVLGETIAYVYARSTVWSIDE